MIESMTSYITRLARAHSVSCKYFYKFVIAKVAEEKFRDFDIPPITRRTINHFVNFPWKLIQSWEKVLPIIDALELLTGRNSLQYLTAIPYGFDNACLVYCWMKRHASWCPYCYQEWKDQNLTLYEPLVWLVDHVKLCPVHWHPLSDHCPHCHSTLKYFDHIRFIGYCHECGEWLGRYDHNPKENLMDLKPTNFKSHEEFDTYCHVRLIKAKQRQFLFGKPKLVNSQNKKADPGDGMFNTCL